MASLKNIAGLGFVVLVMATAMAVGEAKSIVVGGAENWRYGYNYTDWALKNSPFYINDKLGQYIHGESSTCFSCLFSCNFSFSFLFFFFRLCTNVTDAVLTFCIDQCSSTTHPTTSTCCRTCIATSPATSRGLHCSPDRRTAPVTASKSSWTSGGSTTLLLPTERTAPKDWWSSSLCHCHVGSDRRELIIIVIV